MCASVSNPLSESVLVQVLQMRGGTPEVGAVQPGPATHGVWAVMQAGEYVEAGSIPK